MNARSLGLMGVALVACSSGSGGYYPGGGDGSSGDGSVGSDLHAGSDLASSGDGAMTSDLASSLDLATAPDLSSAVDFAVAPDFTTIPDLVTLADLSPPCVPGHYVGTETATVVISGININVTGPVDLTVGAAQNGVLPVTGRMSGTGVAGSSAAADVSGAIDCNQLRMSGQLQNGKAMAFGLTLNFTGTIAADVRLAPPSLVNGTLTTNGLVGSGTWSASLMP
jgi:hypothetical protein